MINKYQIIDYSSLGIQSIEVNGDEFHYLDLFEMVGRQQFMTTFNLRKGSEARNEFGESALGVIYYESRVLKKLNDNKKDDIDFDKIRIDSPDIRLSLTKRNELKIGGIKATDIESITYFHFNKKTEIYDTGEKKVPNIVEVPIGKISDVDIMSRNHLVDKHNRGDKLFQFQKEELIGVTLGMDGHIDSRILNAFGFDEDSMRKNLNIWIHHYKFKERRGKLSNEEKKIYKDIQNIQMTRRFEQFSKELKKSGTTTEEIGKNIDALKKIMESCLSFSPDLLLYGRIQVYWDIESYLHITMRHIKEYQLGKNKEKTPFLYRASDLKKLIKKVLDLVHDEYETHISEKPDVRFYRSKDWAIFFNGDHYTFTIDPSGRLVQFHTT